MKKEDHRQDVFQRLLLTQQKNSPNRRIFDTVNTRNGRKSCPYHHLQVVHFWEQQRWETLRIEKVLPCAASTTTSHRQGPCHFHVRRRPGTRNQRLRQTWDVPSTLIQAALSDDPYQESRGHVTCVSLASVHLRNVARVRHSWKFNSCEYVWLPTTTESAPAHAATQHQSKPSSTLCLSYVSDTSAAEMVVTCLGQDRAHGRPLALGSRGVLPSDALSFLQAVSWIWHHPRGRCDWSGGPMGWECLNSTPDACHLMTKCITHHCPVQQVLPDCAQTPWLWCCVLLVSAPRHNADCRQFLPLRCLRTLRSGVILRQWSVLCGKDSWPFRSLEILVQFVQRYCWTQGTSYLQARSSGNMSVEISSLFLPIASCLVIGPSSSSSCWAQTGSENSAHG